MSPLAHALVMVCAGIGVPLLAALNAALGRHLDSPSAAALILFAVALGVAAAATVATGPRALAGVWAAPRYLLLGGVLIAGYVLSITYVAPRFGVGNAVFFVLLGQLVSSAVIDQFGLFGAIQQSLTPIRLAGIGLMALGLGLTRFG